MNIRKHLPAVFLTLLASIFYLGRATGQTARVNNIVLVHGAFVDGSGWKPVFDILVQKGYHVSVVQQTLSSFESDVDATKRVINQQNGPCILVGHSYGGAVITEAGHHPLVAGLVYIAAHAPDQGENEADLGKKMPSAYRSLQKGPDNYDLILPQNFPADFAADLDPAWANFMAYSQIPTNDKVFHGIIKSAAWKEKPCWYMVAGADRIINPDLERFYAKRTNSRTVTIKDASHAVFASRPKEVAALIIDASRGALLKNNKPDRPDSHSGYPGN